jgi:hypothetical protein
MSANFRSAYQIVLAIICILVCSSIPIVNADNITGEADHANLIANTTGTPSEYFITIDPPGDHKIGDVIFINGTTNLPSSKNLTMEIMDLRTYGTSHIKSWVFIPIPGKYVSIPFIKIIPDTHGINRWSVNVTDPVQTLNASEYLLGVRSETNANCDRSMDCPKINPSLAAETIFITFFPTNSTNAMNDTSTLPSVQYSEYITQSSLETGTNPTTVMSSPLSGILPIMVIIIIVITNSVLNRKGA